MQLEITLIIFILLIYIKSIVIVPEDYQCVLERLGVFNRVLRPGFHQIIPFFEMVVAKIRVNEQELSIPRKEYITKDKFPVFVAGTISFQIQDVVKVVYQVRNLQESLFNLVSSNLQSIVGEMNKEDLMGKRDEIGRKFTQITYEEAMNWGVKIIRTNIQDISPQQIDYFEKPKDYYAR